jgi:plastocyanin
VNRAGDLAVMPGMNRILRLAAAAAAVAIAVAACSSASGSPNTAAPSVATTTSATAAPTTGAPAGGEGTSSAADDKGGGATTGTITIQNFAYGTPLTVAPGATVKVTNMDTAAHDVSSDDQGKFKTPLLNQGESATFTAPTQPGAYKFSCTIHANMSGIGTLIVHG